MNLSYIKNRYHETFIVEPSDLGHPLLTKIYKTITGTLKIMPFMYIIPVSIIVSLLLSFMFGFSIVRIASLLQNGF